MIMRYCEQLCFNKLDNLEDMDTFLESCKLPRLNYEEKENRKDLLLARRLKWSSKTSQQRRYFTRV